MAIVPKKESGDKPEKTSGSGSDGTPSVPQRLQSLSQRSAGRGGASSRGAGSARGASAGGVAGRARFQPKVVARRTKEERDSTAPQEKVEVKPTPSARGRGGFGGRGGQSGRGRGRGRFEPVISPAIGPLAAPVGVDSRGSRFTSPGMGFGFGSGSGSSRHSSLGADLVNMVGRVKSETPGGSSGYSSRATSMEVEENRIDMTQNTYVDGSLSEFFPVRLDRREEEGEEDEEEEGDGLEQEVKVKTEVDENGVEVKSEPIDDIPSKLHEKEKKKKKHDEHKAKRTEAAIFEEEQLRELSRMTHDHRAIAKEFNMDGKQKVKEKVEKKEEGEEHGEGEGEGQLDELEEIEKRLYFFQFPLVMPKFKSPPLDDKGEKEEDEDDDLMIVDGDSNGAVAKAANGDANGGAKNVPENVPSNGTTTINTDATVDTSQSVTEGDLPEGLIGKLRLHKSGKLTMIVGNVTMDVSQGTECSFLQDVVVMDTQENSAYLIGQVSKKMVLSPEIDDETLLNDDL